jgi:hypothetical protein
MDPTPVYTYMVQYVNITERIRELRITVLTKVAERVRAYTCAHFGIRGGGSGGIDYRGALYIQLSVYTHACTVAV